MARLKAIVAVVPAERRPRVYFGQGSEGLETGLPRSINMEVLDAVGATNVATGTGLDGIANVSAEQILSWNPDVILAASPKFYKSLLDNPAWSSIRAVENKHVYRVPSPPYSRLDIPPGINRLIGGTWLASLFYPEDAKLDLVEETRRFYKLFYHVDITDDQLAELLAAPLR